MTLRARLFLAQLPLGVALLGLVVVGFAIIGWLGHGAQRILRDNYRSVLAMERMHSALAAMDRAVLLVLAEHRAPSEAEINTLVLRFETELTVEENNITEPGEAEATQRVRSLWARYRRTLVAALHTSSRDALSTMYTRDLLPTREELSVEIDRILSMNQRAMVARSDDARRTAHLLTRLMALVTLVALIAAFLSARWLRRSLLRPLEGLTTAVQQVGAGDLASRAPIAGHDELARLASAFNEMADRLSDYRASSLGELMRAQDAAQATIDSLPDAVIVFEADGGILAVNRASEALLGLSLDRPERSSLAALDPTAREVLTRTRDHVLSGKGAYVPRGFEEAVRLTTPEGDRYVLPRGAPLYDGRGIAGASVVLQDVTRFQRFEELRNDLVATVAHEVRTPLTSLWMAIHLCAEEAAGPLTDKQADLLDAARRDCLRLQGIVDDLLDLSHLSTGTKALAKQPVAPQTLVRDAVDGVRELARASEVDVRADVAPLLPLVNVDAEQIGHALTNLLANAIRHSPRGEEVRVSVGGETGGLVFSVTDAGPGIAPEHQTRLFERFYRVPGTRGEGSGLGLSIAQEIVRAHGGDIGVRSTLGRGATFWFSLPLAAAVSKTSGTA